MVLKLWWAISWRALTGMVAGACAGLVGSLSLHGIWGVNLNPQDMAMYGWLLSAAPAGLWGVRCALRKPYRDFQLRWEPPHGTAAPARPAGR